ncbi:MAG: radical SAM protein [Elusimicrobia bacterium]|nr:radical SAM protein [Elusimicrobiota bacterium]
MKKPRTAAAAIEALGRVLAEVSRQFSRDHRLACRAHSREWPLLTVSFGRAVHRLRLVPARDCQRGSICLPGFHLVRLGRQDQAQEQLFFRFLRVLLRHEGWRLALSTLAAPAQASRATVVERLLLLKRCNQRCRFCGGKEGQDLSRSEAEAVLEDIRRRHPKDIASVLLVITGGEPTLAPHLPRLIRRAHALGIESGHVLLTTNGVRLADAGYAASLQAAGLTRAEFAFHSHQARAYDLITGTRGHFAKAEAGLRQALSRFEVTVNTVINRYNYTRLPDFVRYLHRMRDETCGRLRLMPSIVVMEMDPARGADWEDISVSCSKLAPFLVEAVRWDHAQAQRIFIDHFDGHCYAPVCVGRGSPEFLEHAPVAPVAETIPYLRDGRGAAGPDGSRVKALSCRRCRYDPFCLGVTPVYAAKYGLGELSPL